MKDGWRQRTKSGCGVGYWKVACLLPHQWRVSVAARIVGINMVRFLLYIALALNFPAFAVTAADRYGGWLIEQPRSSVRTFSFKQSVQLNNKILTSELGFVCDQRKSSKSVGVNTYTF
jgi:hypothetical protein